MPTYLHPAPVAVNSHLPYSQDAVLSLLGPIMESQGGPEQVHTGKHHGGGSLSA